MASCTLSGPAVGRTLGITVLPFNQDDPVRLVPAASRMLRVQASSRSPRQLKACGKGLMPTHLPAAPTRARCGRTAHERRVPALDNRFGRNYESRPLRLRKRRFVVMESDKKLR